jgi:hypothetical protein
MVSGMAETWIRGECGDTKYVFGEKALESNNDEAAEAQDKPCKHRSTLEGPARQYKTVCCSWMDDNKTSYRRTDSCLNYRPDPKHLFKHFGGSVVFKKVEITTEYAH